MSNEERIRVLQMVAERRVTPEEADEVLGTLEPVAAPSLPSSASPSPVAKTGQRTLRINVHRGRKNITVRIPSGLPRESQQFLTRQVVPSLAAHGVGLDELLDVFEQFPSNTKLVEIHEDEGDDDEGEGETGIEIRTE
jgi:hypothetical protein